jgi:hypothetical protein
LGGKGATLSSSMLRGFLKENREEILLRARTRVGARSVSKPTELHPRDGLPLFLDRLEGALLPASVLASAGGGGGGPHARFNLDAWDDDGRALGSGLTIDQAIHDYGDLCRVVTELAIAGDVPIPVEDCIALDLCFDAAVACAASECHKA